MKTDIALAISLFDSHLTTISVILGIISVIFVVIGYISFRSLNKHIEKSVNEAMQGKIDNAIKEANIRAVIEKALNEKIENYRISIQDVTKQNEKTL